MNPVPAKLKQWRLDLVLLGINRGTGEESLVSPRSE
jgi:hypothetical protein